MTDNIEIHYRFAIREDQSKIYDFAMRAISESVLPKFAEDAGDNLYDRIINGDPKNVAIAEVNELEEGIVGYIEVDPNRSSKEEYLYIRGIFVLEAYRRRGIGRTLLKMMYDEKCKNNESLLVHAFTETGVKFWQSYGFKIEHYSMLYTPTKNNK